MSVEDNALRTQEQLAQEGLESIGQKLFNTINIELSGNPQSARRWIWELLQNAKDVIAWLEEYHFEIQGIVCDGLRGMFQMLSKYRVQMCFSSG